MISASRAGQQAMKEIISVYLHRIERDTQGLPIKLYPFTRETDRCRAEIRSTPGCHEPNGVVRPVCHRRHWDSRLCDPRGVQAATRSLSLLGISGWRQAQLKKRSAAKPPDDTVFFMDRSLGAEPLRSLLQRFCRLNSATTTAGVTKKIASGWRRSRSRGWSFSRGTSASGTGPWRSRRSG